MRTTLIAILIAVYLITGTSNDSYADSGSPFRVIALDVGEGQSILLQRRNRGILVDTGHAGKAVYVLQQLRDYGVEHLDYLILTHLHPDHASGYFRIRESFPRVPVLVHNFSFTNTTSAPDMSRWVAEALARDPYREQFRSGNDFIWQGLTINPLWPGDTPGSNMNDSSLVIEVKFGSRRVLLMGDVGDRVEKLLMDKNALSDSYDALVAGHHGSRGTSSEAFLNTVNPAYSIISTNANNIRGYPAPATQERLSRCSRSGLFETFSDGNVCLEWKRSAKLPTQCLSRSR